MTLKRQYDKKGYVILDKPLGEITDQEIIRQAKQQCIDKGMNPELVPTHTHRLNDEALAVRRAKYSEYIEVIQAFVNKFLSSGSGNPVLITITDNEGFILDFARDPTIIETAGIWVSSRAAAIARKMAQARSICALTTNGRLR